MMLKRKIQKTIEDHFLSKNKSILLIDGARQVGKTYIVRTVGQNLFKNFVELNMVEDSLGERLFESVRTTEDFYLQASALAGDRMNNKEDTLIFIDEIQAYPHLLTMLKFLASEDRYTYVASGSLLGVTLAETTSIPMGSIRKVQMYPLSFEEFLYANSFGELAMDGMRKKFENLEPLSEALHTKVLDLFKKYLLVGGMPGVVVEYLETKNIQRVRDLQKEIHSYYATDAAKYSLDVKAVSNPVFPLIQSAERGRLKLYLNDPGILSSILYGNNIRAVLDSEADVNLGALYETVVATELANKDRPLYYYDSKKKGEVDFLIDDFDTLSVAPIEVKSGKDYMRHSSLDRFVGERDYGVKKAFVFSNERDVKVDGVVVYLPIYYVMFV